MRIARLLSLATLACATTAGSAAAQQPRLFRDSWFWGLKGGVMTVSTRSSTGATTSSVAPTFGGEWLITRTQGALYAAFDNAMFTSTSYVEDATQPSLRRNVDVTDLRRFTIALLAFPKQFGSLRPYAGAGIGINLVGAAKPQGTFTSNASQSSVAATINERKSGAAPVVIGGIHADFRRVSVFSQASFITLNDQFLVNGSSPFALEFGVRYNLAPAKERPSGR